MISRFKFSTVSQFHRDTKLLIAASGILAVSFFGIQMLLKTLYVLRLGYGLEYVGIFNAVGALMYMGLSLPSGALGTRFGVLRTMYAGGLVVVFGMAMLPLVEYVPYWARDAWPILAQMVLTGGFAMFGINLVPALMSASSAQNRNDAFAVNSMLRGFGTFVGTIIGGILPGLFVLFLGDGLDSPAPYRWSLWVGAALGLVALIPLTMLRNIEQGEPRAETQSRTPLPLLPLGLVVVHVYFGIGGSAVCQSFCNAYMDTELRLSAATIGLITGVGQFAAVFAPLLAPGLAGRHSNGWIMMIATLGISIFLVPLALFPHWSAVGISRLGILSLAALWMPALQVFQMELVDSYWRSIAYGTVSMAMGLSFGSISLVGGYIAATSGYSSLFLLGAILSAAGGIVMWGSLKRSRLRPSPTGAS